MFHKYILKMSSIAFFSRSIIRDRHNQCFCLLQTSPENCRDNETLRSGFECRRVKQARPSKVLQHLQDYGLISLPFFYYLNSLLRKIFPLLVLRPKNAANCLIHTLIKLILSANVKDSRKLSVLKKFQFGGRGVCIRRKFVSFVPFSNL